MVKHSDPYPLPSDPMFYKQQGIVNSLILSLTRLLLLSGDVELNPGPLQGKNKIVTVLESTRMLQSRGHNILR